MTVSSKYIENHICPFCQSDDLSKYKQRSDELWVMICNNCNLGFVEKYPENLSELYKIEYYEKSTDEIQPLIGYSNYNEIGYDYFLWAIALVALTKSKGSLLDIGCSNGLFLDLAKIYGCTKLTGVELNPEYAELSRNKGYKTYSQEFISIDFDAEEKYDIITAWAVLEHIPELNETLEKIKSILKPGGLLFFEVPCITFTENDQYWLTSSLEHIYYFTEKSFRAIMKHFFGGNYTSRVVTLPRYGASLIGFVSASQEKLINLKLLGDSLNWITRADLDNISLEDLSYYLVIYSKYIDNIQICEDIISSINSRLRNQIDSCTLQDQFLGYFSDKYIKAHLDNNSYLEAKEYFISRISYLESEIQTKESEIQTKESEIQTKESEIRQLRFILDAMTTSKFWKIRSKWLKIRRFIGIEDDHLSIISGIKKLLSSKLKKNRLFTKIKPRNIQIITQTEWQTDFPLVSVIIPCFNYGHYVEEAIDSVLNQTFQNLEIIVVDDGSTDPETIKIISNLDKPKTKIIRQENQKLANTRNNGIKQAKGKYICCLDADDLLKPTYLEKCLVKLETENLDICYTWVEEFGDSQNIWKTGNFDLGTLIKNNCVEVSAVFKRSIWQKTGGYDGKMIEQGYEDWSFWIAIAKSGGIGAKIDEPLFLYRKHGRSMIDNASAKHQDLYEQIKNKHQELYKNPRKITEIQGNIKQYVVTEGYRNLLKRIDDDAKRKSLRGSLLFVLPFTVMGGVDTVLLNSIKNLRAYGFDVYVCTTIKPLSEKEDSTNKYEAIIGGVYHLPNLFEQANWKEFIFYLIESKQINIIVLAGSSYFYTILPDIKQKYPHIKIVDQLYNEYGHIDNNRKYATYININIVENERVQDCLLKEYHENPEKIKLIHNGVDTDYFDGKKVDQTNIPNIPREAFIVSFIGRFSEEKCPELFVEIVNQLKSISNLYFIMAGHGPMEKKIKAKINSYNLKDKIHLPGIIDARTYLAISDLVILPSKIDGRPNIVLESLSMGVPVIASNVGGLPGIIRDGYNGFLCKSGDLDSFVNRIKQVIEDDVLYGQMKDNARKNAVNHLNIHDLQTRYIEEMNRLLAKD